VRKVLITTDGHHLASFLEEADGWHDLDAPVDQAPYPTVDLIDEITSVLL
jgi:hypothetical protein